MRRMMTVAGIVLIAILAGVQSGVTASGYEVLRAPDGTWLIGAGHTDPGTSAPEGALFWRTDLKTFKTFTNGTWTQGPAGQLSPAGATLLSDPTLRWNAATPVVTPPICNWTDAACAGSAFDGSYSMTGRTDDFMTMIGGRAELAGTGTLAATKYAQLFGFYSNVLWSGQSVDANGASVTGASLSATAKTGSTNSSVIGVAASAWAAGNAAGGELWGMVTQIDLGGLAASFDHAVSLRIYGAKDNVWGADLSKVYKIYANYYGRSLIDQPSDTQYALELTNGQGQIITGKTGQLQFAKAAGGARPACTNTTRGSVWYEAGGGGVADTFEVCRKDAADAYAWVALF